MRFNAPRMAVVENKAVDLKGLGVKYTAGKDLLAIKSDNVDRK